MEAVNDSLDRSHVSNVVRQNNPRHPMLYAMRDLQQGPLRDILQSTLKFKKMKGPNCIDRGSLDCPEMQELKKRFIETLKSAKNKEPSSLVAVVEPRPCNRRELYGRVVKGEKILDVGSGDGKRLKGLTVDAVTIDKEVEQTVLKAPHIKGVFCAAEHNKDGRILTSFNAITQDGVLEQVREQDGIHVAPNHAKMLETGIAVEEGGRICVKLGESVWSDSKVDLPAQEITSHSVGVNTYKQEQLVLTLGKESQGEYVFDSVGSRYTGELGARHVKDMSLKLDGELVRVVVRRGRGSLFYRDSGIYCPVQLNREIDLVMFMEFKLGRFFLIRLDLYSGYVPFHSLAMLELFLQRKRFLIRRCGKQFALLAPIRCTFESAVEAYRKGLAEGVVFREKGEDVLVRVKHSLDFTLDGFHEFVDHCRERGLVIDVECPLPGADLVYEFVIERYTENDNDYDESRRKVKRNRKPQLSHFCFRVIQIKPRGKFKRVNKKTDFIQLFNRPLLYDIKTILERK